MTSPRRSGPFGALPVFVLGLLLGTPVAPAAEGHSADILTYPIGAGDELHVEIVGQPDMSGDFRVDANGDLTVPLAGKVHLSGLTLDAAREAVASHLAAGYLRSPQVYLDVKTFASRLVEVSGAVREPAVYPMLSGQMTVSEMLVSAGGLLEPSTPRAEIWRDREGLREVIVVDLDRLRKGDQSADPALLPGDRLFVPLAEQVFVDGQVQKPGAIVYRDGMTASEAVVQAGGALGTARLRGAYILRDGTPIPVNLKRIQRGADPDVPLSPSDRLYLPETIF
jgi:polysaccharide export outer membrane protein